MKRILSMIISLSLLLSTCVFAAEGFGQKEEKVENSEQYERVLKKLENLGFISNDIDYSNENAAVKRVDFIVAVLKLIGEEQAKTVNEDLFTDVDKDYYAAGYIKAAIDLELLNGYEDGSFMPKNDIALSQVAKVLVKLLGDTNIAESKGGYPDGYMSVAFAKDLFDGVKAKANDTVTYGDMLKMFDNMLDAPVSGFGFNGDSFIYNEKEETFSEAYHDIYYEKGILNATPVTALMGQKPAPANMVRIENTDYYTGVHSMDNELGFHLDFYYKYDEVYDERTIVYFEKSKRNNFVTVNDEDIEPTDSPYEFIYSEKNKTKTVEITNKTNIIVNGKIKPFYDVKDLSPETGFVTLIDNNDDNKYDVINILSITDTIVVGQKSRGNDKVTLVDMFNPYKITTIKLDDSKETFAIYKNSKRAVIEDLAQNNVLSIAKAEDDYCIIYVSDAVVKGSISQITEGNKITVGEEKYMVLQSWYDNLAKVPTLTPVKIGTEAKFHIDFFGNVAALEKTTVSGDHYGYVLKTIYDDVEEILILRILKDDGEIEKFLVKDSLVLNDTRTEIQDVYTKLNECDVKKDPGRKAGKIGQIIKYRLNEENAITRIYTTGETKSLRYEGKFNSTGYYSYYLETFGREYYEYPNTKVFCINEADEDESRVVSTYRDILGGDSSVENSTYEVFFYNKDDTLQVDVILRYTKKESVHGLPDVSSQELIVMVEKVEEELNDDDEPVTVLYGTDVKGVKRRIYPSSKTLDSVVDIVNKVKPGDIVIYQNTGNGNLKGLFRLFERDKYEIFGSAENAVIRKGDSVHGADQHCLMADYFNFLYAKVVNVKGNNVVYTVLDDTERMLRLNNTPVSEMDISGSVPKIRTGLSVADIMPGDKIFMKMEWGNVKGAIIVKTK